MSNKTAEGYLDALHWLDSNPEMPSKLRHLLIQYYQVYGRDFPWRRTSDPYKILIAEVLLQKTAVKPVKHVWMAFIHRYPDVRALAGASIEELEMIIHPLGIHKKAKTLLEIAQAIVRQTGGEILGDANFLKSLPGVGSYTAGAVLSFSFNINALAIDVNAARVFTRIGGFFPHTLRQGLAFARTVGERVATEQTHKEINYGVLDLAAQICKTKPLCDQCPLLKLCEYGRAKGLSVSTSAC